MAKWNWRAWTLRGVAVVLTAGGLVLCHSRQLVGGGNGAALMFFAVLILGGALVLLTRGVGARLGMLLGVATGLAAAAGLVRTAPTPTGNLMAFVAIAAITVGFLGHLAGGWGCTALLRPNLRDGGRGKYEPWREGAPFSGAALAADGSPAEQRDGPLPAEMLLGALVTDFRTWVESEAGRRCYMEPMDWTAFEEFVQAILWDRLGATGVRILRVSADGERLEPLRGNAGLRESWPSLHSGLIGQIVRSGRPYVAPDTGSDEPLELTDESEVPLQREAGSDEGLAGTDEAEGSAERGRWAWLLPLLVDERTCVLVMVSRVERPGHYGPALAEAIRGQLNLFWAHLLSLQALSRHMRVDCQSGMLNRAELLSQVEEAVRTAVRDKAPIGVLAVAIEGLRRLDDTGRWLDRDLLVQRLGSVLRAAVRSDDLLGRFNDERFVVVLRGIDPAQATSMAQKLLEAIRQTVLGVVEGTTGAVGVGGSERGPSLRAGLAGAGPGPAKRPNGMPAATDEGGPSRAGDAERGGSLVNGRILLERALGLLDYARLQRIDIATDLMKGLPPRLTRDGDEGPRLRPDGRENSDT